VAFRPFPRREKIMPTPIAITVKVTFTSTENPQPTWTVSPEPVLVPPGEQTIVWNLDPTSTAGAKFNPNKGIEQRDPSWPGANPTRMSDTQWSSPDNNNGGKKRKFIYMINVRYQGKTYTNRNYPQIENQPMGR